MEKEGPGDLTESADVGKPRKGADWPKLVLILLILSVGYFLWGFANEYSNNLYFQTSPLTEIFTSFRLAADLLLILGLSLTLVVMKTRGRIN